MMIEEIEIHDEKYHYTSREKKEAVYKYATLLSVGIYIIHMNSKNNECDISFKKVELFC